MDMMQKLGGRKFIIAIIVTGAAMFLETKSDKGLSPTMASFLIAIVSTFSIANYASTAKFITSKGKGTSDTDLHDKVDELKAAVVQGLDPRMQEQALTLFQQLGTNMVELREVTRQTAAAVVNLSKRG